MVILSWSYKEVLLACQQFLLQKLDTSEQRLTSILSRIESLYSLYNEINSKQENLNNTIEENISSNLGTINRDITVMRNWINTTNWVQFNPDKITEITVYYSQTYVKRIEYKIKSVMREIIIIINKIM